MTDREYALEVLAQRREAASMVFAQKAVVADFERLGQRISPRVLAGAIKDAGSPTWYATLHDYELALGDFICRRRRHARVTFDLAALSR